MLGNVQQVVGETIGSDQMATDGQQRQLEGQTELKAAQTKGYVEARLFLSPATLSSSPCRE
jgi:uncharacterized protein YjbJ (UPF0337 family)